MKILTICSAGLVRSVSMAHILKQRYGQDAIAAGHDTNSQETLDMLSDWADRIIVMKPEFAKGILKRNAHKIVNPELTNVGEDVWGNPMHLGLQRLVYSMAAKLHEKGILKKP